MSQRQDSYQVVAFMKTIFEALTQVVRDYNGTIKDYVGDAVYAFWDHGFKLKEEQALSACKAALKQLQVVNDMQFPKTSSGDPPAERLAMGWGITTGKVTMSHYGWRVTDLTLVGDSTNSAFRLSNIANKDFSTEIVICSQTAKLVNDVLLLDDLGLVALRGRSGQEHVYGIIREDGLTEEGLSYEPSFIEERISFVDFPEMVH